ncbi:MAG: PDZ domain-containing protein [Bacteroidales bacterium]|nr:PDZ domain-containing protein [Bacteroidales bacterium]
MLFSRIAVSAIRLSPIFLLAACSDYLTPVESTPTPSEYEYNYWLLQRTYLFEDELGALKEDGESVKELYSALKDRYTRYVEPSKSEAAEIAINTTMVPGDIGMTYLLNQDVTYPLFVYRVYPNGPAGRAGVPRYANIISINDVDLGTENALDIYNAVLDTSTSVTLRMIRDSNELEFTLTKETVYAPSIFIDTLDETIFISITGFKPNTADMENGTYGELKAYLDSTTNVKEPRVIDIRSNPGGHVEQCVSMADRRMTISAKKHRSCSRKTVLEGLTD